MVLATPPRPPTAADARTTRVYTLAPSALGGIISIRDVPATGANTDTWYHYDRLGNVMLTSDSAGASNGLRWQDAYGNTLSSITSGAWATASASDTPAGFITKPYDGDVGLVYGWQRWYDPELARYVHQDPLFAENLYPYANGNPISMVDPDGRRVRIIGGSGRSRTAVALAFRRACSRLDAVWNPETADLPSSFDNRVLDRLEIKDCLRKYCSGHWILNIEIEPADTEKQEGWTYGAPRWYNLWQPGGGRCRIHLNDYYITYGLTSGVPYTNVDGAIMHEITHCCGLACEDVVTPLGNQWFSNAIDNRIN